MNNCIVTSVKSSRAFYVFLWTWLKVFLLLSSFSLSMLPLLLNFAYSLCILDSHDYLMVDVDSTTWKTHLGYSSCVWRPGESLLIHSTTYMRLQCRRWLIHARTVVKFFLFSFDSTSRKGVKGRKYVHCRWIGGIVTKLVLQIVSILEQEAKSCCSL